MLSPGKWHELVPKTLLNNLEFRVGLLKAAEHDPLIHRGLREICQQDVLFFVNVFVWQTNPLHVGHEVGPFITWDFQDEAIIETIRRLLMGGRRDALWEKSREMGATWMALIIAIWLTLFHENKRVLCISHSEEA